MGVTTYQNLPTHPLLLLTKPTVSPEVPKFRNELRSLPIDILRVLFLRPTSHHLDYYTSSTVVRGRLPFLQFPAANKLVEECFTHTHRLRRYRYYERFASGRTDRSCQVLSSTSTISDTSIRGTTTRNVAHTSRSRQLPHLHEARAL